MISKTYIYSLSIIILAFVILSVLILNRSSKITRLKYAVKISSKPSVTRSNCQPTKNLYVAVKSTCLNKSYNEDIQEPVAINTVYNIEDINSDNGKEDCTKSNLKQHFKDLPSDNLYKSYDIRAKLIEITNILKQNKSSKKNEVVDMAQAPELTSNNKQQNNVEKKKLVSNDDVQTNMDVNKSNKQQEFLVFKTDLKNAKVMKYLNPKKFQGNKIENDNLKHIKNRYKPFNRYFVCKKCHAHDKKPSAFDINKTNKKQKNILKNLKTTTKHPNSKPLATKALKNVFCMSDIKIKQENNQNCKYQKEQLRYKHSNLCCHHQSCIGNKTWRKYKKESNAYFNSKPYNTKVNINPTKYQKKIMNEQFLHKTLQKRFDKNINIFKRIMSKKPFNINEKKKFFYKIFMLLSGKFFNKKNPKLLDKLILNDKDGDKQSHKKNTDCNNYSLRPMKNNKITINNIDKKQEFSTTQESSDTSYIPLQTI